MGKLDKIIKEEIHKLIINEHQYKLTDPEELFEYLWLKPNITQLNVDIFVDDGGAFSRHNHELLLFARNGYDKSIDSFIPFSIQDTPHVLDNEIVFNISYNDIFQIMDFIQANTEILKGLACDEITQESFVSSIHCVNQYVIVEERMHLNEMATLKAVDSNLPMDVWLDEGGTYQGHAPRLKFRASNEQKTTREFSSMLLVNPPAIENMPNNSPIKRRDIEKLKQFVINNLDNLIKLANGEIDYITEFKPNMIKG